ncbi:RXLR effector domain-containing protein [Phytophthora infestans]|uniref:RXLR effector domain-containing protein n=1 Tax=Phytophthora infestans TaxID=4787 RepID=A0A8S9TWY2_PHYIN|nr:RXLR effector domain-containing protein [Phytophthora infestans]
MIATLELTGICNKATTIMRLILWALFATLVVFFSSGEASSFETNKPQKRTLYSKSTSRSGVVNNLSKHDQRVLRGEGKMDDRDEAEERGVSHTITEKTKSIGKKTLETPKHLGKKAAEQLRRIKAWYLGKEAKILERRFKELVAQKKSYDDVKNQWSTLLYTGRWSTPSGFKRFLTKYDDWLKKNGYLHLAKKDNP